MRYAFAAIFFTVLALVNVTTARIISMSVTSQQPIHPGQDIDVTFGTRNSLTNNEQYYAIFGWTTGMVYANTLGSQPFANVDISSYPKGGKNFTVTIKAPDYFDGNASKANLTSAIFSQTGASGGVSILFFDDVVEIAK